MKPEKLYIYEIEGTLDLRGNMMGENFMGCWNEAGYSYLFFSSAGRGLVDTILESHSGLNLAGEIEMKYEEWEPEDAFVPFEIPPLRFVPAWMNPGECKMKNVSIDPGVVFGSGTHSTTSKCIEFLVGLMESEKIAKVLDLGTGTGILAISAALLGAGDITAVDNNNLAVETAGRNVELNKLGHAVRCERGDASDYMETGADLILANIIAWKLHEMFIAERKLAARYFIISGIREPQLREFLETISIHNLEIIKTETDNSWCTLLLKNRSF
jgi:ribosomal protein L11 methyltransferase